MAAESDVLARLTAVLRQRLDAAPDASYAARLYREGLPAMAAKIVEEADETARAAEGPARELVHEVADLWFHTLALLVARGLGAADVLAELERRFGVSGLEEKARRGG